MGNLNKEIIENDVFNNDVLFKAIDFTGVGITISYPNINDSRLVYVNREFTKQTGYSLEDSIGKSCLFLQGAHTNKATILEVSKAIQERKKCNVELLNYKKNGEEFWSELTLTPIFDDHGEVLYFTGIQNDITERKHIEDRLNLYGKVVENTLQGVMITDSDRNIITVNHAFSMITGYSLDEVQGKNPDILSSGKHDAKFYEQLWLELVKIGQWNGEIWNKRKNGTLYPELLNISVVKNDKGEISNYVAVFSDITESKDAESKLREANKKLEELTLIDGLTRIANRRHFDAYLNKEWEISKRTSRPISLIMIDIDFFKKYNDSYGHLEGDSCLQNVAKAIKESINREGDLVSRYGGEEFGVILSETGLEGARHVAETIRRNVMNLSIAHKGSDIEKIVTVSIGVASRVPGRDFKKEEIILSADNALYMAKNKGRNRVEVEIL